MDSDHHHRGFRDPVGVDDGPLTRGRAPDSNNKSRWLWIARKSAPAKRTPSGSRFYQRTSVIQNVFELSPDKVFPGFQVWRLVTYAFCHAPQEKWHIIGNMMALRFFGPTLERM